MISLKEYLRECAQGLEMAFAASTGSGNPANPNENDVLMVGMRHPSKPDEIVVSYLKYRNTWLFFKGMCRDANLIENRPNGGADAIVRI